MLIFNHKHVNTCDLCRKEKDTCRIITSTNSSMKRTLCSNCLDFLKYQFGNKKL
jgi:hypothetical protein